MSYVGHAVHDANVAGLALQASRVKTAPVKPSRKITQAQMVAIFSATKDLDMVANWSRANFPFETCDLEAQIVVALVEFPNLTEAQVRDYYTKYGC